MNKLLIPTGLATVCLLGIHRELEVQERLAGLERAPRADPADVARLTHEVSELESGLESARAWIQSDPTGKRLEAKLAELETQLSAADDEIACQEERLSDWSRTWDGHAPEEFERRLANLRRIHHERGRQLEELTAAARVAREDRERIESLDASVNALLQPRDEDRMWHDLVGPVVQIAGDVTVGSGVLLESQPLGGGKYLTHLLTAWHVVRDIYGGTDHVDRPIAVKLYLENGTTSFEDAEMIAFDTEIDIALLRLVTDQPVHNGARLASRERLQHTQVFDPIYAVGCPLGNDPIPTCGEIADVRHHIDGERYWMISAPTYIGNSGGGIFDAKTHELLGVFSKIYTHGGVRSTIVPHMGLATPLSIVYDWLDAVDYAKLDVPSGHHGIPGVAVQAAGLDVRDR